MSISEVVEGDIVVQLKLIFVHPLKVQPKLKKRMKNLKQKSRKQKKTIALYKIPRISERIISTLKRNSSPNKKNMKTIRLRLKISSMILLVQIPIKKVLLFF
jgi:hypothetical protein